MTQPQGSSYAAAELPDAFTVDSDAGDGGDYDKALDAHDRQLAERADG